MSKLQDLIDTAWENNWCTRPYCTTCGAHTFRARLKEIDRDEAIAQLATLDAAYFARDRGTILTIIYDLSTSHMARELLPLLGDSPAGLFLQNAIEIQEQRDRNRQQQLADSSPEAVAQRAAARRQLTEEHRIRKALTTRRTS